MLAFNYSCFFNNKHRDNKEIKSALLKTDFQVLRQTLEESHPGLYWYSDKSDMDHYFDSTYTLLDDDMTRTDFFKILLPLIANIKCLHTNLRLPEDSRFKIVQFARLLPFNFFCTNGKIYIAKDFSNTGHAGVDTFCK